MKKMPLLVIIPSLILGIFCSVGMTSDDLPVIVEPEYNIEMVVMPAGMVTLKPGCMHPHTVDIHIDSFYIGKYEVTQAQWKAVMGDYEFEFPGDDMPAEMVSWDTVQVFLEKLSEATGHFYRLPTEAEWEFAYRAGSLTDYYFGNDTLLLGEYEWYNENSGEKPHPVGMKKPNPWGLYDIGGNVGEWTSTPSDLALYQRIYPDRDFIPGTWRIYRGSHYLHTKFAARYSWAHTYRQHAPRKCVGFRLVRDR